MLIVGLTGSVASGKNYVSEQFKRLKVPVFDADLEVHNLLAGDQVVLQAIKHNFPQVVIKAKIDTKELAREVFVNKKKLIILEEIIYPRLRKIEDQFIKKCRYKKCRMAILNIPLLFEKGGYRRCNNSVAVITPVNIQKYRFLKRLKSQTSDLSWELASLRFEQILQNQSSNQHKRKMADFLIYNGLSKGFTTRQTKSLYMSLANYPTKASKAKVNSIKRPGTPG